MAITIVDHRTTRNEADSITDWTGGAALFTAEPTPKELTGCIGVVVSNTSVQTGHENTVTTVDLSAGEVVYIWALGQGIMDTKALFGVTAYFSDGTNRIGYAIAGSDVAVFRHDAGQTGWQCLVIDTGNLPASNVAYAGSEASLDWTSIEVIGVGFKTLVKAVGGVENCFVDVIRYGNDGISVYGGTAVAKEVFESISTEDESNTDGKAYGIFRKLGTQLFSLQGVLKLGDAAGTNDTYFSDTSFTINFADAGLGVDKMGIVIQGNSTAFEQIAFTDGAITAPAGAGAFFDASTAEVLVFTMTRVNFVNIDQSMLFANTGATAHIVSTCKFDGCAQIDPGATLFEYNLIKDTADGLTGALLLDASGTDRWDELSFQSPGAGGGHGIYITATGTYTFKDFSYIGFGADGSTDAAVYNNSGGAVTINVLGGSTPTVRNGTGASTTVTNAKTLVIYVRSATTGSSISGARVYLEADAGGDLAEGTVILNGLTSLGFIQITDFNYTNDQPVTGRVRMSTSSPFYKTGRLGGDITVDGYEVTVYLVDDE